MLGAVSQILEILVALALAPLLLGWVNQWRAWLQNKSGPGVLQPYRLLHKLFLKDAVIAELAALQAEIRYKPLWMDDLQSFVRGLLTRPAPEGNGPR